MKTGWIGFAIGLLAVAVAVSFAACTQEGDTTNNYYNGDDDGPAGDDDDGSSTPSDCYENYGDPELYLGCIPQCGLSVTCVGDCMFDLTDDYTACLVDAGVDPEPIACLDACADAGRVCIAGCGELSIFCATDCMTEFVSCSTSCDVPRE